MLRDRGRPRVQAPPGYVTVPEAAEIWGVSPETIRNRMKNGTLDGKVDTLTSGERRYYARKSAVEKYLTGNGAPGLLWGDQGPVIEELAERQENIERRLDSIEDAIREVLATLQQLEQSAERERDERHDLLAKNDRTESPKAVKKLGVSRRIDGDKVRFLRESKLLRQEELAKKSGVSRATVSAIETGSPRARRDTFFALAAALEVEPEELLASG
jgi:DNA-binding XRE family transcriptional regulator